MGRTFSVIENFGGRRSADGDRLTIVCFGDSITNGFGVRHPWCQVMGQRLKNRLPLRVINSGVDGDTLAGGRRRLSRDVLSYRPRLSTIAFGLNDLAMSVPLERFRSDLEWIVTALEAISTLPVLLTTVRPAGHWFSPEILEQYNQVIRSVAGRRFPLLDIWRKWPRLDQPDAYFLADGVHPNETGHAFLGRLIADFLRPHLFPA